MRAVHVVGGGPAGAMAAFAAIREGAPVRIFEKSAFPEAQGLRRIPFTAILPLRAGTGCESSGRSVPNSPNSSWSVPEPEETGQWPTPPHAGQGIGLWYSPFASSRTRPSPWQRLRRPSPRAALAQTSAHQAHGTHSDHDLERYHLGIVVDEAKLAPLEEHLLACPECVARAEQTAVYVDTLRAAIIEGNFDLE